MGQAEDKRCYKRHRRKTSEVQNRIGLQPHHSKVCQSVSVSSHLCPVCYGDLINFLIIVCRQIESHEDTYMTLDPKSVCSNYDTLDVSLVCCLACRVCIRYLGCDVSFHSYF